MLDVCAQGISLSAYTVCRKMLSKNPRTRMPPQMHTATLPFIMHVP
jgi:hypothetical protein